MKTHWIWISVIVILVLALGTYFFFPSSYLGYTAFLVLLVAILLWRGNAFLWKILDNRFPWREYGRKRFFIHLLLGYILSVSIINLSYLLLRLTITQSPPSVDQLLTTNLYGAAVFIPVFSMYFSIQFLNFWRTSQIEMEKVQKESIHSELKNLKNHLDPHFLFNNLNILSALIDKDTESSKKFLMRFAQVYRKMLQSSTEDLVSLEEEMDFIDSYSYLLDARFGKAINMNLSVSSRYFDHMLPPLTLQMLIENAVKHNVASIEKPLKISVQVKGDSVEVSNDIRKKEQEAGASSGTGLQNIRDRISYFSDKELVVENTREKFTVLIPLIEIEEV